MNNLSVDEFCDAMQQWTHSRSAQFKFNWLVKGGWESWIQVDLAGYILGVNSAFEMLRDQPIFRDPQQKIDLLLNTHQAAAQQIPVRIRAQSLENRGNFIADVRANLDKLGNDRTDNYSDSTCVMMAITCDRGTLDQLLSISTGNGDKVFACVFQDDRTACAAAVWRRECGWIQCGDVGPQKNKLPDYQGSK